MKPRNKNLVSNDPYVVRFQVITSATTKITHFWDVTPCNLIDRNQYFGITNCLSSSRE
jgi:hypothetical protein